jgi:hypothetical protein
MPERCSTPGLPAAKFRLCSNKKAPALGKDKPAQYRGFSHQKLVG